MGDGISCALIAELGINHDGDLAKAKRMIDVAAWCGATHVKTQIRTPDLIYSAEEQAKPLPDGAPWKTRGEYVHAREFSADQHRALLEHAHSVGLSYGASAWDLPAFHRIESIDPDFHKIASPMVTSLALLEAVADAGRRTYLSTGMSTWAEIDHAVVQLRYDTDLTVLHCVSAYPAAHDDLNLRMIHTLGKRYGLPVGYSGHELGIAISVCARVLGATAIERHFTLDRSSWGSDHSMSLEPDQFRRLCRDVRAYEKAQGDGQRRTIAAEAGPRSRLRRGS